MREDIVNVIKHLVVLLMGCFAMAPALASDFDGSNPLICATVEARDCVLGMTCYTGEAKEVGAPAFMRIDFAKKTITGPARKTPISSMEKSENQLLMQGSELGYGWALAINLASGDFSGALTNSEGTFLLFGSCTLQ